MKFSELKELVYKEFRIDHLADIARELNVSPQAVSNWKSRDHVPYKYVKKVHEKIANLPSKDRSQKENINLDQNLFVEDYNENTISLIDILSFSINHLRILVITPLIFCILMILYVQLIVNPIYVSSAKIMSSTSGVSSSASDIAAQFGVNIGTPKSEPQWVYTEIIRSRTLARSMLKRRFDTIEFGKNKTLLDILMNENKSVNDINFQIREQIAVNKFIGMITVDKKISHYELSIAAHEPLFARDIASALIEELELAQRDYNKSKTSKTRQFVEERIIDTEKELNNSEEALKNFRDRNRRMENSPALLLEQQRLSREVSVLIGVFTTLKQQLENIKIEEVKESDYVIVLDPPEAPLNRSKPNKRLMVVLAGFFGLFLGSIISIIKDYYSNNQEIEIRVNELQKIFFQNLKRFTPYSSK